MAYTVGGWRGIDPKVDRLLDGSKGQTRWKTTCLKKAATFNPLRVEGLLAYFKWMESLQWPIVVTNSHRRCCDI